MTAVWVSRHEDLVSHEVVSLLVCDTSGCPSWLDGARWGTHRGEQGIPAVTLSHRCDGLHLLFMAVWCPCRRPSLCRPVHREVMRSAWLDVTTIVPTTPCHQRNYVNLYSRDNQSRSIPV